MDANKGQVPFARRFAVPFLLLAALLALAAVSISGSFSSSLLESQQGRRLWTMLTRLDYSENGESNHVGYFLRTVDRGQSVLADLVLNPQQAADLEGVSHYRILPGIFPKGMQYHFDGLATVLQFNFSGGKVQYRAKAYESQAEQSYDTCIFLGTGTGPTLGHQPCITNPGVNLLPIQGQLWLTIDTSRWGRVDPGSLETLPDKVEVRSTVLNAHPACDRSTGECYVQYTCAKSMVPLTDQACFGLLRPQAGDMLTEEISRATLPKQKLIQHSHSPCVTQHYVVSKLDAFTGRNPLNFDAGLLKLLHQDEDNLWMVMDRKTNASRILQSSVSFVNNHFWNCFEVEGGDVVVDAVAATQDYLDNYFERNLDKPAEWSKLFHPALRCRIPSTGNDISCSNFFQDGSQPSPVFDYPTFNPKFKMNPSYRWFYAIAPKSSSSRWFDQLIKVDVQSRSVSKTWSSEGIYLTEADFIPRNSKLPESKQVEDDGILVSVVYNSTSDSSNLALFDAQTLELLSLHPLAFVVPFHAHGIVCHGADSCYTNP